MSYVNELIDRVEKIARRRPSYSLTRFLPAEVLELGVLSALEHGGQSGAILIRDLSPLSRRASGYGVHYPLLHQLTGDGLLESYLTNDSNQRYYSLTDQGQLRLTELRQVYTEADATQFQTGLNLVAPAVLKIKSETSLVAC